ncbi:MAG: Ig-like domain-containing protein, partial [Pseudorhodobacter sp.]
DREGRIAAIETAEGGRSVYRYGPGDRLAALRDVSAGQGEDYAYDAAGRLIAATGQGQWFDAVAGFAARPLSAHLPALLTAGDAPVSLGFGPEGKAALSLSLRESETREGPVLLAVMVAGTVTEAGSPTGAEVISRMVHAGVTTLVLRVATPGVHLLVLDGAAGASAPATLTVLGDLNGDGRVDAADAELLADADLNGDGRVDATDRGLFAANFGFVANRMPEARTADVMTYAGLAVRIPVTDLALDPEGDTLFAAIGPVTGGSARIVDGGRALAFTPQDGFTGQARVVMIVDDGHSARTVQVEIGVSAAPLLSIDIETRGRWLMRGETFTPAFSGLFDGAEAPVALPDGFVALELGNPDVARLTPDGRIVALADGITTLIARRGDALAVTVLRIGAQPDGITLDALIGLTPYPDAVTLAADGGTRQLLLLDPDGLPLDLSENPPQFFSSNAAVAVVDATGLIRAVGPGMATVTLIRGGAEARVDVLVAEAQGGVALVGRAGAVIENAGGYQATIAPGALLSPVEARIETVDQADLPIPFIDPSFGWIFGAAFNFDIGDAPLLHPAQLAIPTGFEAGTEVIFYRYALLPTENGWEYGWAEVDTGFVDAQGRARTASPPADGIGAGGVMVVSSVIPSMVQKVDTSVRLTFALAQDPMRAVAATQNMGGSLVGTVQNGQQISVSFNTGNVITKFWNIAASGIVSGIERVIDIVSGMDRITVDIPNRLEATPDMPKVARVILQRLPDAGGVQLEITGSHFRFPASMSATGRLADTVIERNWVVVGNPTGSALEDLSAAIIADLALGVPSPIVKSGNLAAFAVETTSTEGADSIVVEIPAAYPVAGKDLRILRLDPRLVAIAPATQPQPGAKAGVSSGNAIGQVPAYSLPFEVGNNGDVTVAVVQSGAGIDTNGDLVPDGIDQLVLLERFPGPERDTVGLSLRIPIGYLDAEGRALRDGRSAGPTAVATLASANLAFVTLQNAGGV